MILVDSSIWIDHFRTGNQHFSQLLSEREVCIHSWIIGELACGYLHPRKSVLATLNKLPQILCATESEVLHLIESQKLIGTGIGYLDMHLLASARLQEVKLWTRDRRLQKAAADFRIAYSPA